MDEAKLTWGETPRDLPERWPRQEDGTPEAPAFLTHRMEWNYEVDLIEQMLRAYDIPVLKMRGDYGSLGKIVFGFSGEGVDLFVPAPLLEDAQALLEPAEETNPETTE